MPRKNQFAAKSDISLASFDIFGIFKKCIDTFVGERFITNERKNQFRDFVPFDLYKSFRTVSKFSFDSQSESGILKHSKALHKIVFDMLVVRKEVILPDKIAEQE